MTILEKDIRKAKEIINEQNKSIRKYKQFDRLYPFTNENIKGIFNKIDLHNKKCLVVLGSGDQALDMCLKGSNNITSFDINRLTKYYYDLKKAALLSNITMDQYLDYFCYYNYLQYTEINRITLHPDTFSKICVFLNDDSYKFWCSLYEEYHPLRIRNGCSLFLSEELKHNILKETINYLSSETNFYTLKEKIKDLKFEFIHEDIDNLPHFLTKQYDFMYLSNIIQYIDQMYLSISGDENKNQIYKLQKFKELINLLSNNLTEDGSIIIGYIFNIITNIKTIGIFNKEAMEMIFNDNEFSYLYIEAIEKFKRKVYYRQEVNMTDKCLIYKK